MYDEKIKSTGAAKSTAAPVFSKTPSDSPQPINVALIGVGAQGTRLRNAFYMMPGIRIKAVCDIWEYRRDHTALLFKKFTKIYPDKFTINAYSDYKEMLAEEKNLDAVIIATPDFCHEEQTVACLNAGLHVYCEQPMSNTVDGARNMLKAQKRTGKLLQIGYQRRSNPKYLYCKQNLIDKEKLFGRITAVNSQWHRTVRPDLAAPPKYYMGSEYLHKSGYKNMHQFMNWQWFKGLGSGPYASYASQQLDAISWFLGTNPTAVTASGGTDYFNKKTHQWPDNVLAVLEYDTELGKVRTASKVLLSNSMNDNYETYMGTEGILSLSEFYGEGIYPQRFSKASVRKRWEKYIVDPHNKLVNMSRKRASSKPGYLAEWYWFTADPTDPPPKHALPDLVHEKAHVPHLRNFFNAVRGGEELNCPGQAGFAATVIVHKAYEAIKLRKTLSFDSEEFKV